MFEPLTIILVFLLLSMIIHIVVILRYLLLKQKNTQLMNMQAQQAIMVNMPALNPNPVMRFDLKGRLKYANPASLALLEHWQLEVGKSLPNEWQAIIRKVLMKQEKESLETMIHEATYMLTFAPDTAQKEVNLYGIDMTEKSHAMQEVSQKILYDAVTKLPTRTLLTDYLKLEIERLQPNHKIFIFLIYIMDYSELSSVHALHVVEGYIKKLSESLEKIIGKESTLGRFSERGFMTIESAFYTHGQAVGFAQKILEHFNQPLDVYGIKMMPRLCIGITVYPDDSDNPDILFRNVKLAQGRAIANRKQVLFYQSGMDEQVQLKRRILVDLHQALKNQELMVYYQPQMSLSKNQYVSAESLLRWRHPTKGFISPFFFVSAAEESGLIIPIGRWIIEMVCKDAQRFKEAGCPLRLAINLSTMQFMQDDLVETVLNCVQKYDLKPNEIELEITEGVAIQDVQKTIEQMNTFRKHGFSLAIDDFGTGYSSLSYLQQFPIQKLKIDRAFIKDMHINKQSFNMTRGIIELGHSLNMHLVAEGAELKEQVEMLKKLQCDVIQGYYFSPPMPFDKVIELLKR